MGIMPSEPIHNPKKRANVDHLDGVELDADQSDELDIMGGQFKRKKKKPKPRSPYDSIGEVYAGNPKRKYDVIVYRDRNCYTVVYPKRKYIGNFKTKAKVEAFLRPAVAVGLKIDWSLA